MTSLRLKGAEKGVIVKNRVTENLILHMTVASRRFFVECQWEMLPESATLVKWSNLRVHRFGILPLVPERFVKS